MNSKLLSILVIVFLSFISCNQPQTGSVENKGVNAGYIAYVNVDTLMEKYQFAKDLNEEFTKKQENMTADLNVKAKKLDDMIKSFQYRLQNNGFSTRKRAEQEQRHIQKKQQELQELNQTLQQELAKDYQKMTGRLQDTILSALKLYNKDGKYALILRTQKGGNVLWGNPELDITEDFIEQLNSAYDAENVSEKDTKKEEKKEETQEKKEKK